jgi:putative hemolysin
VTAPGLPSFDLQASISPLHCLAVAGAVLATAFGTLAIAALIGYSPTRLQQALEDPAAAAPDPRLQELDRRDPEYLVVAFLLAAAGWTTGLCGLPHAIDPGWHTAALVGFVLVQVWIGSALPAAIAHGRNERVLLSMLPALRALWFLARWPLVLPILTVQRLVLAAFRLDQKPVDATDDVQKQVVAAVADTVTESNETLASDERTWIGNIVGLKERQVSEVMTPRPEIVAFHESMPLREAIGKALEHGFSRYPVFRDRIDLVHGVFHVKDALRLMHGDAGRLASETLAGHLREPLFVPETTGVPQLLRRFQASNQHLAIVIDEYGSTQGLVTVEDVLEEIVGDIGDEYDAPNQPAKPDEQVLVVEPGRVLELPARTTVPTINRLLDCDLPEDGDWETIAGLVIARFAHIPTVGESIVIDGVEFRVLAADKRRIHRLRATLLANEPAEGHG